MLESLNSQMRLFAMSFSSTSDRHFTALLGEDSCSLMLEDSAVGASVEFFLVKAFLNEERSQFFDLFLEGDFDVSLPPLASPEIDWLLLVKESLRNEWVAVVR